MNGLIRFRHLILVLGVLTFAAGTPLDAHAQVNPFGDEEEESEKAEKEEEKKKEKGKGKKKDDEENREEEEEKDAEPDEEEAAAEKKAEKETEEESAEEPEEEPADGEAEEQAEEEEADRDEEEPPVVAADRVPLTHNFSSAELITTGVVLPVGLGLAIGGTRLFGEPPASMTTPELGSLDYRLSIASHGDLREGTPFLFGIFDVGGIAYPSLLGGFYLLSGMYLWAADKPLLDSQSVNIDHSMIGMAQTVGWTALAAGMTKLLTGRQRPYAAFDRTAYGDPEATGANGSFFSTTAALSFAMSSFAARDYADWATRNGQNPVTGIIAPYAVLYGVSSLIGYSSIYNQQHYLSDILVAAVIGSLIGNLSYVAHFDGDGNPRERYVEVAQALGPVLLKSPAGKAKMGLGLNWRW